MANGHGLVLVKSAADLDREEQAVRDAEQAEREREQFTSSLAGHLRKHWEQARDHKRTIEERMLQSRRALNGEYDPDKLSAIRKQGGSEIYMMLTATKAWGAKAWIREVLLPPDDDPFGVDPTPIPDLPEEIHGAIRQRLEQDAMMAMQAGMPVTPELFQQVQEKLEAKVLAETQRLAKERATAMEAKIKDAFEEGSWKKALSDFISNVVDYPCGFIKGPILRRKRTMKYAGADFVVTETIKPEWEAPDPFDMYPMPGVKTIQDGGLFERHRLTRRDLHELIGVPGYDEAAIREVLREHREGGLQEWLTGTLDTVRAAAQGENTATHGETDTIDALEYWGSVPGSMLLEWGLTVEEVPDQEAEFDVCAWLIGRHVIKVALNYHPLGDKPYGKASYYELPNSFWGKDLPFLIKDIQQICNAAARALANNMGIASGPQGVVNVDLLAEGQDMTNIYPWKLWQTTTDKTGSNRPPVEFFNIPSNAQELLGIYEKFARYADDFSIPAFAYGSDAAAGAGKTATGLSMLMGAASKVLKAVISNIDAGGISPMVHNIWLHLMRYDPDPSIKGDIAIVARGPSALIQRELIQVRRQEFLGATANPLDAQIIGIEGRAALLREQVRALDMPVDDIVPPEDVLMARMAPMGPAPGGPVGGPVGPGGGPPGPGAVEPGPAMVSPSRPPLPNPQALQADGASMGGTDVRLFGNG